MAIIAGALEVQLYLNMAGMAQDLAQAKTMIDGMAFTIERAVAGMKMAVGTLTAGLSVHAFVEFARGAIDAADHLNDLSKKTGIAVETLGGLGSAKQARGNLDSVAQGATKLNGAIRKPRLEICSRRKRSR